MFDCHVHGPFSSDSNEKMEKLQAKLHEKKDLSFILTEHWDYDVPNEGSYTFNIDEYSKASKAYRSERLLFGIEFGLWDGIIAKTRDIAKAFPFDVILGSIHTSADLHFMSRKLPADMDKKTYFNFYFQCMLAVIKQAEYFDVLAHIDYISRYIDVSDPYIRLAEHGEILEELFKELLNNGKILELNTKLLFKQEAVIALEKLYQLYYDLGGRYVTLGSDAHHASDIAKNFQQAIGILEKCQLRTVSFLERKMVYI